MEKQKGRRKRDKGKRNYNYLKAGKVENDGKRRGVRAAKFEKLTSRKSWRAEERRKRRSYCYLEGGNQKMGNRKTETKSDRGAGRRRSKTKEKKRNQKKGKEKLRLSSSW